MKKSLFIICFLAITSATFAQKKSKKDYLITLKTTHGTMHMVLFDDTPLHKANFIKLVDKKFFDSLLFHRVIDGFMIQGGDPNSRNAKPGESLGHGGGDMERIPYEFTSKHVHKKGALAAARDNNPEKKSSACQFYIVQGKKMTDEELSVVASRNHMDYTNEQRADYIGIGGTPRLDNNYTVFGEVIDNIGVIDSIATQARDAADRPLKDVKMAMTVKKMKKKKITKLYGYKYQ
ncbi:peptidylprolyl isomerase [Emticicia soli]|uniref:peptidylprolyl isomerase n=1 Tax=Emticicia soli TaxID=2027878 RepID=A0ABW5JCT5_9BACT